MAKLLMSVYQPGKRSSTWKKIKPSTGRDRHGLGEAASRSGKQHEEASTVEDKRLSQEAGFDYHLIKPVGPAAIKNLLVELEARSV
jgi:hypothetical protein